MDTTNTPLAPAGIDPGTWAAITGIIAMFLLLVT